MATDEQHLNDRIDPPSEVLRVALAQLRCSDGDKERNTARACEAIRTAADDGADLVLFPELYLTGILQEPLLAAASEARDGDCVQAIKGACRQHHVGAAIGFVERDDAYFNTTLLTDKAGTPLQFYRKTHLWVGERERCAAGDVLGQVSEFEGVKFGILTCYDIEFPEAARHLALHGAQCILVPTANMVPWAHHHRVFITARALENHVFVAYCNRSDCGDTYIHTGDSAVVDPLGRLVADLGAGATVACVSLDFSVASGARRQMDDLQDRRPELYSSWAAAGGVSE
jgi:predicted amidohydrolase